MIVRILFALLALSIAFCSIGQTKTINISNVEKGAWKSIKVESKDTSFIYFIDLLKKKNSISLFKTGEYTFTFTSVFGNSLSKKLVIGKKQSYKLKVSDPVFCNKVSSKKTFADKLQTKDTLFIIE